MRYTAGVVLAGEDLIRNAFLVRCGVLYVQQVNGAVSAESLQMRDELAAFAARETALTLVSAEREKAKPPGGVIVGDSLPQMMTVRVAAGLLGVSPQAVRGLCRTGQLLATRSPADHWRIDTDSAAMLAARRKDRDALTTVPL